jgi:hypothetical protein
MRLSLDSPGRFVELTFDLGFELNAHRSVAAIRVRRVGGCQCGSSASLNAGVSDFEPLCLGFPSG